MQTSATWLTCTNPASWAKPLQEYEEAETFTPSNIRVYLNRRWAFTLSPQRQNTLSQSATWLRALCEREPTWTSLATINVQPQLFVFFKYSAQKQKKERGCKRLSLGVPPVAPLQVMGNQSHPINKQHIWLWNIFQPPKKAEEICCEGQNYSEHPGSGEGACSNRRQAACNPGMENTELQTSASVQATCNGTKEFRGKEARNKREQAGKD